VQSRSPGSYVSGAHKFAFGRDRNVRRRFSASSFPRDHDNKKEDRTETLSGKAPFLFFCLLFVVMILAFG
jgi:hypothetical protein